MEDFEGPEMYENDAEEFERNQLAIYASLERNDEDAEQEDAGYAGPFFVYNCDDDLTDTSRQPVASFDAWELAIAEADAYRLRSDYEYDYQIEQGGVTLYNTSLGVLRQPVNG